MSALVGRDRELHILIQALDSARQSLGACVLLNGEAGIGKSRLVEELKLRAASDDFEIVEGDCFQQDASFPYAPWIDLLRKAFAPLSGGEIRRTLGPLAPEFSKLLPELRLLIPDVVPNPPLEPAAEKYRSFEALSRFLLSAHAPRPCLIILEDLHWSDTLSLELVHFLVRRISHLPVLLIGTYRMEDASPHLERLLSDLNREHLVQEIVLKPLNRDEVERLVSMTVTTQRRISPGIVDALLTLTDGNPLFLEEILKSLAGEGRTEDLFQQPGFDELPIPPSIQWMVQQRVEQLPDSARQILILAAVIGQRLDFGLLQLTSGQSEQELLQALKELMAAHLVVQESADQFAFRHALTRQAVYSMPMLRERRSMHQTIGESMERFAGALRDVADAQLAYHFHQAGVWQKAMEYSERAGQQALALYASREALTHLTHALDAARQMSSPPPAGIELRLHRGRAHALELWGQFDEAIADYEAALALSRQAADRAAEWQAQIDLGLLWQSRDLERAGGHYREALELAHGINDPSLLAQSLNRIGNWNMNQGRVSEALPAHREALELFRKSDDRRGMAQTLELLGLVTFQLGDFIQGTAYLEQAVPILRELDDRQGLVNALANLVFRWRFETAVLGRTNYRQLVELSEEARQIAHAASWPLGEARALIMGAGTLGQGGDYARALEWLSSAEGLVEESGSRETFARLHLTYGSVLTEIFAFAEAREHLETARGVAPQLGSGLLMLASTVGLVVTWILDEDLPRAKELLDSSLPASFPEGPVLALARRLWSARAELELAQGNPIHALEIVDWLLASTPNLAEYGPQSVPHFSRIRGQALAALGRMAEAETEFQGTLVVAMEQGQRPLLWRLHIDLARLHGATGRREDAEREFSAARVIIYDLANHTPEGPLRQNFLERASAATPPPPMLTPRQDAKRQFGGLTARERQVATLIALGKSNREIADELVISEKTAERHVANILLKLDFNSRTQVAVWALEKGLHR